MKYCFVFVCQQGELEIKASLLAASLHRHLKCDHELVAAVPTPEQLWGTPGDRTKAFLKKIGVRFVSIKNQIDEKYPIGNKVSCLLVETSADKIVFLDSDILMMSDFAHHPRFEIAFNAKPADLASFSTSPEAWKEVYKSAGVEMPATQIRTTLSRQLMPLYFNAGVVAVHRDAGLGQVWLDCCRAIDQNPKVVSKRPWLDQLGLPVAVTKLNLQVDFLDDSFNYPAHMKRIDQRRPPLLCHYHYPRFIRSEPSCLGLVRELMREHPELSEIIASHSDWNLP
jgi:hypothetical protein